MYIDLGSVNKGKLTHKTAINLVDAPSRAQRVIEYNDILFQCVRPYQLNNYLHQIKQQHMQWVASTGYAQIRTSHNASFVYQLINTQCFNNKVLLRCTGSNYPAINSSDLADIDISIPLFKEQQKIASLLSLIDERIAAQKKIIEELKVLKSAIAERLFSCRTSCAEYFYRDLFAISSKRNKDMARTNILSASQEFGMIERDKLNIDIKFNTESINTYKLVDDGDYIIHLRSFQGGLAFSAKSGICSPAYTILKPSHLLEYGFLKLYFTSKSFIKSLVLVTYGIRDGRSISVDEFLDLTVYMPTKDEQKIISTALNKWDNKIANEAKLLELLKDQKQYLLSQMFI